MHDILIFLFLQEQQRMLRKCESLQLRLDVLEKDNDNVIQTIAQKDSLLSKFQDENSIYR